MTIQLKLLIGYSFFQLLGNILFYYAYYISFIRHQYPKNEVIPFKMMISDYSKSDEFGIIIGMILLGILTSLFVPVYVFHNLDMILFDKAFNVFIFFLGLWNLGPFFASIAFFKMGDIYVKEYGVRKVASLMTVIMLISFIIAALYLITGRIV